MISPASLPDFHMPDKTVSDEINVLHHPIQEHSSGQVTDDLVDINYNPSSTISFKAHRFDVRVN
jgi:hypothetical protein